MSAEQLVKSLKDLDDDELKEILDEFNEQHEDAVEDLMSIIEDKS